MSDLISRMELLNYMENNEISQYIDELNNGNDNYSSTGLYDYVKKMPTAYSVGKIVEKLEERKALHERLVDYETKNGTVTEKYQHIKAIDVLNGAIEIVKQGGVGTDDMCKWRLCDEEANVYDTSCRNPHILIESTPKENGYRYCPYCGKKIKVVK